MFGITSWPQWVFQFKIAQKGSKNGCCVAEAVYLQTNLIKTHLRDLKIICISASIACTKIPTYVSTNCQCMHVLSDASTAQLSKGGSLVQASFSSKRLSSPF